MSRINNPKHPHHIRPMKPGEELSMNAPEFAKAADLHGKGHLKFTVVGQKEVDDSSDDITIRRTHSE